MINYQDETKKARVPGPSRAEIETLCLLYVIGAGARSMPDLAEQLGLSRQLAPAMEDAVAPLVSAGQIALVDGALSLTQAGAEYLFARCGGS